MEFHSTAAEKLFLFGTGRSKIDTKAATNPKTAITRIGMGSGVAAMKGELNSATAVNILVMPYPDAKKLAVKTSDKLHIRML